MNPPLRYQEILSALKKLRDREGLTLAKLESCLPVMEALRQFTGSPDLTVKGAQAKLLDIFGSMASDDHVEAVKNALAIEFRNGRGNLTRRREDLAIHRGKSSDTIRNWEEKGFKELALILVEPHSSNPVIEYDFLEVERTSTWEHKHLTRNFTKRVVRSRVDGLEFITLRGNRQAEIPENYTTYKPIFGVQVVSSSLAKSKRVRALDLKLNRPLNRGEIGEFAIDTTFNDDGRTRPFSAFLPSAPIEKLYMKFEFIGIRPLRFWRNDGATSFTDPLDPDLHVHLEISDTSRVDASFSNLRPGLRYGLAWEWPSD